MNDFEQRQLIALIDLIEVIEQDNLTLELCYCGGAKGWRCDITIGGKYQIGAMFDNLPKYSLLKDYIKGLQS